MESDALEWYGPRKVTTTKIQVSAEVHAGRLFVIVSLIAPGVAQFAIAGDSTAVPKPVLLTTDHPFPVSPVSSIRPDGRPIVTLQVGVPTVTVPPGHNSAAVSCGPPSLWLVIEVVSVVGEHVCGGVTLLQTIFAFLSKPVTAVFGGHV